MRRLLPLPMLLLGLASTAAAGAVIELPPSVVAGREISLEFVSDGQPLAGVEVIATYNPRSAVASAESVGTSGADGRLLWRPRAAGLVRLEARVAGPEGAAATVTRDIGVRFDRVPVAGLVTLLAAAAILGSGLVAGMRGPAVKGAGC